MQCTDCRHSFMLPQQNKQIVLQCRRNPPTVILVPMQTLQGQSLGFQSVFPPVEKDQFCGEFSQIHAVESGLLSHS